MTEFSLYPLRFEPIYQYRLWGGRRFDRFLRAPLPFTVPVGEAWILSDRDDHPSLVADGPLKGATIAQLIKRSPEQMLGKLAVHFSRFPLLLKFLDVREKLSVQVHPSDAHSELIPPGETGKTESWVVLETGPQGQIYAGLKPGTTAEVLREAVAKKTVSKNLASFTPKLGDCVFVRAGTVHSLSDVMVFEIQENSDVTFRLDDWNHVDPKTGHHRPLQVDKAMACIDFTKIDIGPVVPQVEQATPVLREKLIRCDHFGVHRITGHSSFVFGAKGMASVLVCLAGRGFLEHGGTHYAFNQGDVLLLPAVVGRCLCLLQDPAILLEISLPKIL
jgi:mannose-6-phosphate isomerase